MGKTFLVPYDGSHYADQAILFALSMVDTEGQIVLVNVQRPLNDDQKPVESALQQRLDEYYQQEGFLLLKNAEHILENKGISYKMEVRIGSPSIEITTAAKEYEAFLIVMGSRGMSPYVSSVLGSVTYGVLHLAPCPVTIVPFEEK